MSNRCSFTPFALLAWQWWWWWWWREGQEHRVRYEEEEEEEEEERKGKGMHEQTPFPSPPHPTPPNRVAPVAHTTAGARSQNFAHFREFPIAVRVDDVRWGTKTTPPVTFVHNIYIIIIERPLQMYMMAKTIVRRHACYINSTQREIEREFFDMERLWQVNGLSLFFVLSLSPILGSMCVCVCVCVHVCVCVCRRENKYGLSSQELFVEA